MSKRILIMTSWYPNRFNPVAGIFVHTQARTLAQAYEVAVLHTNQISLRDLANKWFLSHIGVEEWEGIPVYRSLAFRPPRSPMIGYFNSLNKAKRVAATLLDEWGVPDLIHSHVVLPAGGVALQLGKHLKVPVILTEHTGPFNSHLQTAWQRATVADILANVDRLIAVSPALAHQIHAFAPDISIDIIGNVIETSIFIPSTSRKHEDPHSLTFLCVALLEEGKGVNYLLDAVRILVDKGYVKFRLVVGGDGSAYRHLRKQCQDLVIANYVQFTGLLSRSEVVDWMQKSDVFVLPSLSETFGIVVGEAMSCGKPVIATRCGGPEFIVTDDTGRLVDIRDSLALSEAMEGFITQAYEFSPQIIRQQIIEHFGEESFLRNIATIYNETLAHYDKQSYARL